MTSEASVPQKVRSEPTRTPISGVTARNRLTLRGKEPGYEYRIINADQLGRLDELQERGYEVVTHKVKVGDARVDVSNPEGSPQTVPLGGGVKGLVVRQKKEWFDEDQKIKTDRAREMEQSISPEAIEGGYGNVTRESKVV